MARLSTTMALGQGQSYQYRGNPWSVDLGNLKYKGNWDEKTGEITITIIHIQAPPVTKGVLRVLSTYCPPSKTKFPNLAIESVQDWGIKALKAIQTLQSFGVIPT